MPGAAHGDGFDWNAQGECLIEGTTPLREINKRLGMNLPLEGPKTVNGLLLELLQDIPDAPIALKIGECVIEVVRVQDQAIKMVKLIRPRARALNWPSFTSGRSNRASA
jgi:Mg2+/Co2+ transporter CorB